MRSESECFSPLFLIVSERSGGNLLMNMISAHPELHSPLPPHVFRLMSTNALRFGDLEKKENWYELLDIALRFVRDTIEPWKSDLTAQEIDRRVEKRTVEEALRVIYSSEMESHGAAHMLLKENEVFRFMPFLLLRFPKSRFVWQVRDPRDMATSFRRSSLFSKLLTDPVAVWELEQRNSLNVYKYLKEDGRMHFHRYEDLLQSPEDVMAKLCSFIGVEYSDAVLAFHANELTVSRAETSDLRKNVANPLMSANFGKYREELTGEQIREIEQRVGDLMEELGYELEYPPEVSKDEQLAKRQEMIMNDQSTSLEDRRMRADRVATIRRMIDHRIRLA